MLKVGDKVKVKEGAISHLHAFVQIKYYGATGVVVDQLNLSDLLLVEWSFGLRNYWLEHSLELTERVRPVSKFQQFLRRTECTQSEQL